MSQSYVAEANSIPTAVTSAHGRLTRAIEGANPSDEERDAIRGNIANLIRETNERIAHRGHHHITCTQAYQRIAIAGDPTWYEANGSQSFQERCDALLCFIGTIYREKGYQVAYDWQQPAVTISVV